MKNNRYMPGEYMTPTDGAWSRSDNGMEVKHDLSLIDSGELTAGTWSSNGEPIPDDMDTNQGPPIIDGKEVTVDNHINIPVVRGGEYLPAPGTIIFLMECPYLPDGMYQVMPTYSMPNDDYEPGIEVPRVDGVGLVPAF